LFGKAYIKNGKKKRRNDRGKVRKKKKKKTTSRTGDGERSFFDKDEIPKETQ